MAKIKYILITFIVLVLVITGSMIAIKAFKTNNTTKENSYSTHAIRAMKEINLEEEILKNEYSKVVEQLLEKNNLEEKYLDEYYKINYVDKDYFISNINKFLDLNYKAEEINNIFTHNKEVINILLDMKYIDLKKMENSKNYDETKLTRYLSYYHDNNYDEETVVTYVNIGLDLEGYSKYVSYTAEEAQDDLTILVNKYHKLPDDYEPDDLTPLSYNNGYYKLRKDAAEAFEKLTSAALIDNVVFYPFSAYRSFSTQERLYNRYVDEDGQENADTYSARPGFSEHQLGLAVDVRSSTLNDNLTPEHYEWMLNNSYKYGFIVRYPKGKQYITQYMEEPWHIRYLGIELATKVHDSGLTYDEYYGLYMEKY